jgi:hypothetical protein
MTERTSDGRLPRSLGLGLLALILSLAGTTAAAQEEPRLFAGALAGVSTLSADARSVTTESTAALSQYAPENGPALNVFAGWHLFQYFSVQANWIWNRNDLTLVSSFVTPRGGGFFEQRRQSGQHAVVADGLVYFRRLASAVRPYLGTGISLHHFSSRTRLTSSSQGLVAPTGEIAATHLGLRSHVGIDVRLSRRISFRYSFSETISTNPIDPALTPPPERALMNFQNLFGFVSRF